MCALALEIHQALKQENATTETQVGYKGKEICSPERQFIGKGTFDFVFSRRNSRVFFFVLFCFFQNQYCEGAGVTSRETHESHTHTYFSRLSPVLLSVFTLTPDLNPDLSFDSLRTQTHFRSSLPFTLPFRWREATTENTSPLAGYSFDRSRVLDLGKKYGLFCSRVCYKLFTA